MPPTAAALLREGMAVLDALDAKVLLCHALGWRRTELITRAEEIPELQACEAFRTLVKRRQRGEPVAQLVGMREFFGRNFAVTPDVLIPRPDTELIVELALQAIDAARPLAATATGTAMAGANAPVLRVLDLGTGSGAIALTLALERPTLDITATDQSTAALALAKHNAARLFGIATRHASVHFLAGDWFAALTPAPAARFDLIVSNPPYIAAGDPHLEQGDLRFEPRSALTDENDGLSAIRLIINGARHHLVPGGPLLIEHGYDQGAAVQKCFADAGFMHIRTVRDLGGQDRVTAAILPVSP